MKGKLTASVLILLLALLAGCGADRHIEVSTGDYAPARHTETSDAGAAVETVRVDRENQTVWFALTDGSQVIIPFTSRGREACPAGCPGNVSSTRMEVLELETEALTIASVIFEDPVLVRNCPPGPEEIVLRSDGEIGGGGDACSGTSECVPFEPSSTSTSLPHSMKGYELYSWYVEEDDIWVYTLVTGTNRAKSYAELAVSENIVTVDGWVKITVRGTSVLKSVLDLLPEGETLLWLDAGQLDRVPAIDAASPGRNAVQEIERHCERRGIDLVIVD